jgi:hypothetical protein
MGYKRMKKRKLMIGKKSKFWGWVRNYMRVYDGPKKVKVDDEMLKWFESPNAEGYLKL